MYFIFQRELETALSLSLQETSVVIEENKENYSRLPNEIHVNETCEVDPPINISKKSDQNDVSSLLLLQVPVEVHCIASQVQRSRCSLDTNHIINKPSTSLLSEEIEAVDMKGSIISLETVNSANSKDIKLKSKPHRGGKRKVYIIDSESDEDDFTTIQTSHKNKKLSKLCHNKKHSGNNSDNSSLTTPSTSSAVTNVHCLPSSSIGQSSAKDSENESNAGVAPLADLLPKSAESVPLSADIVPVVSELAACRPLQPAVSHRAGSRDMRPRKAVTFKQGDVINKV